MGPPCPFKFQHIVIIKEAQIPVCRIGPIIEIQALSNSNCHTLPVTHEGKLVGLLTMDNLGEFMRFQSAMRN